MRPLAEDAAGFQETPTMKSLLVPALAAVIASSSLAALTIPASATMAPTHQSTPWTVLQGPDASSYTGDCYATDRAPGVDERRVGGIYATQQQANAAMGNIASCLPAIHN